MFRKEALATAIREINELSLDVLPVSRDKTGNGLLAELETPSKELIKLKAKRKI